MNWIEDWKKSYKIRRIACWLIVILFARVLILIVAEYHSYFPADFDSAFLTGRREFFDGIYSVAFYAHIISGPLTLVMVFFLLISGASGRWMRVHRQTGLVMVWLVVLVMAPSGLVMATHAYTGAIAGWGFALLSLVTSFSALATKRHALAGNSSCHRVWATRLFICMCSPLLLRLISGVVIVLQQESELTYRLSAWCSWIFPLAFYEFWRLSMNVSRNFTERTVVHSSRVSSSNRNPGIRSNQLARLPVIRNGFNLVELLVVIAVIIVLAGLLLPATRISRGAARRTDCMNRMRQIGFGLHTYHDARKKLPSVMGDPDLDTMIPGGNTSRLSALVLLLPYLEQDALWQQIVHPETNKGADFATTPVPWHSEFPAWQKQIEEFRCPTSPRLNTKFGTTDYGFCIGDMARDIYRPRQLRGAFAVGLNSRLDKDFADGTSRTILMAEIGGASDRSVKGNFALNQSLSILENPEECNELVDESSRFSFGEQIPLGSPGRGGRWADGSAEISMFNTVLRPGAPSALVDSRSAGILSATAAHPAGVNVLFADASIRNISRDVFSGDPSHATPTIGQLSMPRGPTPYGVWGELGVLADGEIPLDF